MRYEKWMLALGSDRQKSIAGHGRAPRSEEQRLGAPSRSSPANDATHTVQFKTRCLGAIGVSSASAAHCLAVAVESFGTDHHKSTRGPASLPALMAAPLTAQVRSAMLPPCGRSIARMGRLCLTLAVSCRATPAQHLPSNSHPFSTRPSSCVTKCKLAELYLTPTHPRSAAWRRSKN